MSNTMTPDLTEPASAVLSSSHYLAECTVIGLAILSAVVVGWMAMLFVKGVHVSVDQMQKRRASIKRLQERRSRRAPITSHITTTAKIN